MVKIACTGGGTGGHIYPGLAVVSCLKEIISPQIFWIGAKTGMDRSIIEKAGIPFMGIPAGKLRRYFSLRNMADLFKVAAGFLAARRILKREKPDLLFSKGGFVSVPPCAAAYSLGIPVFTHESDFSPGLATRINCRFAHTIFTAYAETIPMIAPAYRDKAVVAGNPVRREFRTADAGRGRAFLGIGGDRPVLLVLGGSQGALEINELVKKCLPSLTETFTVVHQTGSSWDGAPGGSEWYKPHAYIGEEMPDVLAAADLVLGRSGAGTVWECATEGKPMVLIPLRGSGTRGDQVENAEVFRKAGAALVLDGGDINEKKLESLLLNLGRDTEKLHSMAAASAAMGRTDAARIVSDAIADFLRSTKK
ncbi:undecaprenyldiphospho-muramoylpentapeptide beta-N-acetylglucosaminyltransferase [Breznakiella homolactica]|uniref:UDP-N-acetylglucosamine--N-acetylmuramyl-(pentapeptide) pyrophosphoryl-undecaprenol N-acetylglucosamine transferase n=1 Tax=Breznakiella homolactica TaxID=2798577 RepID=A0A7T7XL22_9SPIR|nr:undecaprenyldiphospho-muramoylpentapeptide beta-N-acetylglucosaminyltransferase [Breznakiella homolactica]QQO08232.1 undecaprenyldiphospho-muramoylpentapeptide beta-N-acetylglucosaminyltransferase [Breznakiella homolactica]